MAYSTSILERCRAQQVDLLPGEKGDVTSGICHCPVETNAVNDDDGQETLYAGLYASGGEEDTSTE